MIKGIAFDLEGTVVDVEEAHHLGHFAAAKEVGVNLDLESALQKIPHFIGGPDDKIAEEIVALSPDKDSITSAQVLARDKFWYEHYLKDLVIKPRPGFIEFFENLQKMGLPVAIGSLTAEHQATILLEKSGLRKLFRPEHIILREHVQNMKPAPDVFLKTASQMNINPENQLVFEDSPNGVRAARAAGSEAVGMPVYDHPETIAALLEAGASSVFLSWKEVSIDRIFPKT